MKEKSGLISFSAPLTVSVYFNEVGSAKYVPRAVLVDLEPGAFVVRSVRALVFSSKHRTDLPRAPLLSNYRHDGQRSRRSFRSAIQTRQLRA